MNYLQVGYGKSAIARILNDRGVPNPTEYKRLKGFRYSQPKRKNSTLWRYFAISDMLVNEIYIGKMVQGKYGSVSYKTKKNKPRPKDQWIIVENTHEPIIDMELWNKVQDLIAQKTKPFITGQIGVFAKKTRCMNCGYTMRSNKNHGKHYLRCPCKMLSVDSCVGSFISVEKLEQTVINELNDMSNKYLNKDDLETNVTWDFDFKQRRKSLEDEKYMYQKKIEEYTKGLRELYLDKVKGVITESDYKVLSSDFISQKERLDTGINEVSRQIDKLDMKIKNGVDKQKLICQYTNLEHLNREIVEELVDYILIGKRNIETKEVPIEIHWNF